MKSAAALPSYDGMALAQAMIEYIAVCIHAKTLFSTHYHELTSLDESLPVVKNVHVEVHEDNGHVTFMYRVKKAKPTGPTASTSPAWRSCRKRCWNGPAIC